MCETAQSTHNRVAPRHVLRRLLAHGKSTRRSMKVKGEARHGACWVLLVALADLFPGRNCCREEPVCLCEAGRAREGTPQYENPRASGRNTETPQLGDWHIVRRVRFHYVRNIADVER